MSDQPEQNDGGVLRPFQPTEAEPLPPIQPSSIVVPDGKTTAPTPPPPADVAPEPAPSEDAFWSAEGDHAGDPFGLENAVDHTVAVGASAVVEAAEEVADEMVEVASPAPNVAAESLAAAAGAGALPSAGPNPDEITLPRTPFLIGAGVVGLLLLALLFLWQTAGGDGGTETTVEPADTEAPAVDDTGDGTTSDSTPDLSGEVAGLEAQVADQAATIDSLQAEVAEIAPPALAGTDMRRVVVAADASFVSVGNEGVAVIGPFGGYAAIDPATNAVTATGQIASGATRVMRTLSAVWVTNYTDSQIVRIDPITSTVVSTFDFPGPDGVAKLGPTLAVASFDGGTVAQIDPGSGAINREVAVGGQPTDVLVTTDESAVWVALFDTGEVVRIDAGSFEVSDRVQVGNGPVGLWQDGDTLWVVNHTEGTVVSVDMATATATNTFVVGAGPTAAVAFQGSLWVTVTDGGDLVQLDPATGDVITRTPLGTSNRGGPTGLAIGNGSLWVAMQGERSVVRVTPSAG